MNLRRETGREVVEETLSFLEETPEAPDTGVCPPALYLDPIQRRARNSALQVGGQHCYHEKDGAYTGEISPWMLKDIGCEWVIVGHSERRHVFDETGEDFAPKLKAAFEAGLNVIYCTGETADERNRGETEQILSQQLEEVVPGQWPEDRELIIGYEPVWAIGTGESATPDQAQQAHAFIRDWFREFRSESIAESLRIQYGGSVKPYNVADILAGPDVDGALVGSASLEPGTFTSLLENSITS